MPTSRSLLRKSEYFFEGYFDCLAQAKVRKLIVVVGPESLRPNSKKAVMDYLARELDKAANGQNEPRVIGCFHGITTQKCHAALRVLGYCRLLAHHGRTFADEFLEKLLMDPEIKVQIRSPKDARERVQDWARRLFPWAAEDEPPLSAATR